MLIKIKIIDPRIFSITDKNESEICRVLGLILSGKETGSDFGTGRGIRVGMRISRKN